MLRVLGLTKNYFTQLFQRLYVKQFLVFILNRIPDHIVTWEMELTCLLYLSAFLEMQSKIDWFDWKYDNYIEYWPILTLQNEIVVHAMPIMIQLRKPNQRFFNLLWTKYEGSEVSHTKFKIDVHITGTTDCCNG